jgi:hypothetical protein
MRTFAETTTLDLAVAPMIVALDSPGIGVSTKLHALAEACGMAHLEYRLDMMYPSEVTQPLPVLREGRIVECKPIPEGLLSLITGQRDALVIIDFENDRPEMLETFLKLIAEHATRPTIVALRTVTGDDELTGRSRIEAAYDAIAKSLGIHRALVPACTMGVSHRIVRTVRLEGFICLTTSRSGERYCELTSNTPYHQEAHLTIRALPGQDDDALTGALDPLCAAVSVAVLATIEDGDLVCTTDDIEILEAAA